MDDKQLSAFRDVSRARQRSHFRGIAGNADGEAHAASGARQVFGLHATRVEVTDQLDDVEAQPEVRPAVVALAVLPQRLEGDAQERNEPGREIAFDDEAAEEARLAAGTLDAAGWFKRYAQGILKAEPTDGENP